MEFYQQHLDNAPTLKPAHRRNSECSDGNNENNANNNSDDRNESENVADSDKKTTEDADVYKVQSDNKIDVVKVTDERARDRRYLQCPAAVSMTHLQKFIRMKYALSSEHKVRSIVNIEILFNILNLIARLYGYGSSSLLMRNASIHVRSTIK